MREFKFRVWDSLEKRFLIKNEKVSRGIFKDKLSEIVDFENYSCQINNPEDERYIFLQYTGMKDINDKEIYEGDIVLYLNNGKKAQVFWSEYLLAYHLDFDNESYDLGCFTEAELEVIGNIYENSELLEGK